MQDIQQTLPYAHCSHYAFTGTYHNFYEAIPLWKKDNLYRCLYANSSCSLNSPNTPSVSDVFCLFGAVDTIDNGAQIS